MPRKKQQRGEDNESLTQAEGAKSRRRKKESAYNLERSTDEELPDTGAIDEIGGEIESVSVQDQQRYEAPAEQDGREVGVIEEGGVEVANEGMGESEKEITEDRELDQYEGEGERVISEKAEAPTEYVGSVPAASESPEGLQKEELGNEVTEELSKTYIQKKRFIPYRLRELIIEDDDTARRIGKYILLNKVSMKTIVELMKIAYDIGVEDPSNMRRQELISAILTVAYTEYDIHLYAEGVFQMIESGSGFIRFSHNNYLPSNEDVFVSKALIKKYGIRTGDIVAGEIRPPRDEKDKYFSLHTVDKINFADPRKSRERTLFENLIPYYPIKKFELDFQIDKDISCRVVDIIAPIGKGQRGLIVSPPRAGKTMLLQNIARAILENHPDVIMIILLIDERPEEVTDWKRNIVEKYAKTRKVEVAAATFDEKPEIHIRVAEIVMAEAKRLVEYKHDVVIFLDSITRLTRAYNQYIPSSGKVLTGGIDSAALQFPKKFFGAARAIEGGGSLTILATCLIDTGSRMDEVIFEEFKGTGNMEIYLDRRIAERRIFPAIDIHRSGTRKEELLILPEFLPKVWLLRKSLQPITAIEAMELLYERMIKTKNNTELFELMISSQ